MENHSAKTINKLAWKHRLGRLKFDHDSPEKKVPPKKREEDLNRIKEISKPTKGVW